MPTCLSGGSVQVLDQHPVARHPSCVERKFKVFSSNEQVHHSPLTPWCSSTVVQYSYTASKQVRKQPKKKLAYEKQEDADLHVGWLPWQRSLSREGGHWTFLYSQNPRDVHLPPPSPYAPLLLFLRHQAFPPHLGYHTPGCCLAGVTMVAMSYPLGSPLHLFVLAFSPPFRTNSCHRPGTRTHLHIRDSICTKTEPEVLKMGWPNSCGNEHNP